MNHLDSEAPSKRQRVRRDLHHRASKACKACAETKLRCQGGTPCQRCVSKNIPCRTNPKRTGYQSRRSTADGNMDTTDQSSLNAVESHDSFDEQPRHWNGFDMSNQSMDESVLVSHDPTPPGLSAPSGLSLPDVASHGIPEQGMYSPRSSSQVLISKQSLRHSIPTSAIRLQSHCRLRL